MANMLDYLDWRGDLSMAKDPFNEVDNLILAELSYIPFNQYMPGAPRTAGIGCEAIGLKLERGAIVTNEYGKTNVPGVWAAGDVNGIL